MMLIIMAADAEKIDEAVLALLYLNLHEEGRAWKSFDWSAMNRLHAKDLISEPRSKARSVMLTDEGLAVAKEAFERLFSSGTE